MTMIMKHLIALLCIALLANPVAAQTREIREVPTFQKISYRIPGKLFLRQGSPQKVVLEGDRERIEEIKTTVKGDRLIIGDEDEDRWFTWDLGNQEKLNVYITVEHIDGLYVSGSGNAIGETTINADQLDMKVSGSGSLELNVAVVNDIKADVSGSGDLKVKGNCKDLDSSISGSGRVFIANAISGDARFRVSGSGKVLASGTAQSVEADISGSGKVLAAELETGRCEVRISGSGDVEINVKDELDAKISGSGSVAYKGSPRHVNSHSSGSGKVRKL